MMEKQSNTNTMHKAETINTNIIRSERQNANQLDKSHLQSIYEFALYDFCHKVYCFKTLTSFKLAAIIIAIGILRGGLIY